MNTEAWWVCRECNLAVQKVGSGGGSLHYKEGHRDPPYTREQFDADFARVVARICVKHGIAEHEVHSLVAEHRYTHSVEDIEEDYIWLMTIGDYMGWSE